METNTLKIMIFFCKLIDPTALSGIKIQLIKYS
jgi:hypothetical protein